MSCSSFELSTTLVGLPGLLTSTAFVRGVISFSIRSAVMRKSG